MIERLMTCIDWSREEWISYVCFAFTNAHAAQNRNKKHVTGLSQHYGFSYHVLPLPSSRSLMLDPFRWVRLARLFVFADVRIGILTLVEIAERVIDLSVL